MSVEEVDEWQPNDEELLAKINDADLTNEAIRELEAKLVPLKKVDRTFNSVIAIDNLPVTGRDKFKKLNIIISKLYSQFGAFTPDSFEMPLEGDQTKGFAFAEYEEFDAAKTAVERTRNHKLDAKHILAPTLHAEFARLVAIPDEYQAPVIPDSGDKEENPFSWLLDPACVDQYILRIKNKAELFWNDPFRRPDPVYTAAAADAYEWSTEGKYLVTLHKQGAIVMKGSNWTQKKFRHEGIKKVAFSPKDNFFVGWSAVLQESDNSKAVSVWHVATQRTRQFPGFVKVDKTKLFSSVWPIFEWSHDEAYFSRAVPNQIHIYRSDTFDLLNGAAIKAPGVRTVTWCPTLNRIAYWTENDQGSATITIIDVPSLKAVRQKLLENVLSCELIWQNDGKYLAAKVEHFKPKMKGGKVVDKKSLGYKFLIFRASEPSIPIEIIDPKEGKPLEERKDSNSVFSWEPHGDRFLILNNEANNQASVSLYKIGPHLVEPLRTLGGRSINSVKWAPRGDVFVMAGVKPSSGALEFFDANLLQTTGEGHHFNCTDIEWDPTGRFLMSIASALKQQHDCGFTVWKIDGSIHQKLQRESILEFKWRPRPKSLLTPEMIREIEDGFTAFASKFGAADEIESQRLRTAKDATRLKLLNEFTQLEQEWERLYALEREERERIQGFPDDLNIKTQIFEVDEVIEEIEEPL